MIGPLIVSRIAIAPFRLSLREPFAVAYATANDVPTILVRVSTADGADGVVGWGEATPDPNVTGETYASTLAMLVSDLAPALIGRGPSDDSTRWSTPLRLPRPRSTSPSTTSSPAPPVCRCGPCSAAGSSRT